MMIWLSFADTTRPKGFLGVVIVEVDAAVYNPAALDVALQASHRLGLDPGGAVAAFRIPPESEELYRAHMGRLLTRAEVEILGEQFTP